MTMKAKVEDETKDIETKPVAMKDEKTQSRDIALIADLRKKEYTLIFSNNIPAIKACGLVSWRFTHSTKQTQMNKSRMGDRLLKANRKASKQKLMHPSRRHRTYPHSRACALSHTRFTRKRNRRVKSLGAGKGEEISAMNFLRVPNISRNLIWRAKRFLKSLAARICKISAMPANSETLKDQPVTTQVTTQVSKVEGKGAGPWIKYGVNCSDLAREVNLDVARSVLMQEYYFSSRKRSLERVEDSCQARKYSTPTSTEIPRQISIHTELEGKNLIPLLLCGEVEKQFRLRPLQLVEQYSNDKWKRNIFEVPRSNNEPLLKRISTRERLPLPISCAVAFSQKVSSRPHVQTEISTAREERLMSKKIPKQRCPIWPQSMPDAVHPLENSEKFIRRPCAHAPQNRRAIAAVAAAKDISTPKPSFTNASKLQDWTAVMDPLRLRSPETNVMTAKAVEDARKMQAKVLEDCKKTGTDPPPYGLEELIGKGSFGRVYKGKDMKSAVVVAIKIIDIDGSDTVNPRNADTYRDVMNEIKTLSILNESRAKNVNLVIDALLVGSSMWMITQYCAGGSVATLMKPTAPLGLQEKWIIPILREVIEALTYVHAADIIHRDIKCANVLITEQGEVQLCDFGVAGIVENKSDKRSTVIGTPHWMAPELFGPAPSYRAEVDIWALGSMVYEMATGLPPNVVNGVAFNQLGSYLKSHAAPRLEGGTYSQDLRHLVSKCLEVDPRKRPTITDLQKHSYVANTSAEYPTSSLRALIGSFKVWESRGGSRKSLFMQHGAQGPVLSNPIVDDEWNFSTTDIFDQNVLTEFSEKDVYDAYGSSVVDFNEETARPKTQSPFKRRRAPPEALARIPPQPLEKIFNSNTLSGYDDNSISYYGGMARRQSDLPLRDNSTHTSINHNLIDLDLPDIDKGPSSFSDLSTIKADRRVRGDINDDSTVQDFSRPPLSDPADTNKNRRTRDWTFPSMPQTSGESEIQRFPGSHEVHRPAITPGSGERPALIHHPTEPLGAFGGALVSVEKTDNRMSVASLIDLDEADPTPEFVRPSTANSEISSAIGEQPFEYERHPSMYQPMAPRPERHPSLYASDEIYASEESVFPRTRNGLQEMADVSDFSASEAEVAQKPLHYQKNVVHERESPVAAPQKLSGIPQQPSASILIGEASPVELKAEFVRALIAMREQLDGFRELYDAPKTAIPMNNNYGANGFDG